MWLVFSFWRQLVSDPSISLGWLLETFLHWFCLIHNDRSYFFWSTYPLVWLHFPCFSIWLADRLDLLLRKWLEGCLLFRFWIESWQLWVVWIPINCDSLCAWAYFWHFPGVSLKFLFYLCQRWFWLFLSSARVVFLLLDSLLIKISMWNI